MKIKLLFFGLLILVSACKEEKDDPQNYFTYQGKEYQTPKAYYGVESDGIELAIVSFNYDEASGEFSGPGSGVDFVKIKSATTNKLPVGTFQTPVTWGDTLSNFLGIALVDIDSLYSGNYTEKLLKSGTITISESSIGYLIKYEIVTDENEAIKGSYEGSVIKH